MLTTASAIAEVNFTEKTYFTSSESGLGSDFYSTFFDLTDVNGIKINASTNDMANISKRSFESVSKEFFYYSKAINAATDSYNSNYIQITSNSNSIKRLRLITWQSYKDTSRPCQIVLVGWKGLNSASENADYYTADTYTGDDIDWISFDLSSWEDVRTIRIYYGITGGIFVNETELSLNVPNKDFSYPYILGIQVGIDTENISTSISNYGVAAFSSGNALDFSTVTECSAFYADSYANGVLHLTKATGVVPAHFGLLLCSTNEGAVSFSIPIATAACTLTPNDNKFVATDESTYTPTTSTEALALGVKIKNGKAAAGFYYVGKGVTVPQYRFYLPAPSVGGAKNLTLDFDNATGITSIPFNDPATQNSVGESAIPSQTTQPTDLLGRPCPTPRAGALYIKGGKAYLTPAR